MLSKVQANQKKYCINNMLWTDEKFLLRTSVKISDSGPNDHRMHDAPPRRRRPRDTGGLRIACMAKATTTVTRAASADRCDK